MLKIGLTGSIGMGKSTTAQLFNEFGGETYDADQAVARLYGRGGAGVDAIAELAPNAIVDSGVDREKLRAEVLEDAELLPKIEAAIHPLVLADRTAFAKQAQSDGRAFVVYDIPLLFETGAEAECDVVVVVTADAELQRRRVLERAGMSEAALEKILSRQMPDAEKRRRADYVVDTSVSVEDARRQVESILIAIEERFDTRLRSTLRKSPQL